MFILTRFLLRWTATRVMYQRLVGYELNPQQADSVALSKPEVQHIVEKLWKNFDKMISDVDLSQYGGLGSRQMTTLSMLSVATYRALRDAGFSQEQATQASITIGLPIYQSMIRVPRLIARFLYREPQKQMNFILRLLMIYPFRYSQFGYQGKAWASKAGFHTHWYCCPPLEFVKTQGKLEELDFFFNTWCQFDYVVAQEMAQNGHFERPHCLSRGDKICDMRWFIKS